MARSKHASLERRTLVLLALALASLAAAVLGGLELRASSAGEQQRRSFESAEVTLAGLERTLDASPGPPDDRARRARMLSLIEPLIDASAGECATSGALLDVVTIAPLFEAPTSSSFAARSSPRMLPLDRSVVSDVCRLARVGILQQRRFAAPNDMLFIVARGASPSLARFVLLRMPNRARLRSDTLWLLLVPALAVVALALVGLTVDLLLMLRRGRIAIETSLARVAVDLDAPIEPPPSVELRSIADAVAQMVERLKASRDRERALQRSLDHAARLAALGRLVAGVAHEVRNPLAAVKLRLDRLQRRPLDARSTEDVRSANAEVVRLDALVRSLLQLSQRSSEQPQAVAMAPLVDERVSLMSALAAPRAVVIERLGEGVARGDRAQLVQVIDNLLRNAVEASPRGEVVRVRIAEAERALTVTISDRGEGVPEDRVQELFEPFFTTKPDGTGLGLFLSKSLVEAQGGALRFERADNETRMTIELEREPTR